MLYGHNDLQLAKPHFFPIYLQTLSFVLFVVQVCLTSTPCCSLSAVVSKVSECTATLTSTAASLYVVHVRLIQCGVKLLLSIYCKRGRKRGFSENSKPSTTLCSPVLICHEGIKFAHAAVQYGELVFAIWNGRQVFHAIMVGITIAACLRTTLRTYRNRRMLIRCCCFLSLHSLLTEQQRAIAAHVA